MLNTLSSGRTKAGVKTPPSLLKMGLFHLMGENCSSSKEELEASVEQLRSISTLNLFLEVSLFDLNEKMWDLTGSFYCVSLSNIP